jgi:hypothetical protein
VHGRHAHEINRIVVVPEIDVESGGVTSGAHVKGG